MKYLIIFLATVTVFGCATSNKVSSNKKDKNSIINVNEANQVVDNSGLICKKTSKVGSRIKTETCITKEQAEFDRKDSVEYMRRTTRSLGSTGPR
jgi:hypothetical protein